MVMGTHRSSCITMVRGNASQQPYNNGYGNAPQQPYNNGYGNAPQQSYNNGYGNAPQQPYNNSYSNAPQQPHYNAYNNAPRQNYAGGQQHSNSSYRGTATTASPSSAAAASCTTAAKAASFFTAKYKPANCSSRAGSSESCSYQKPEKSSRWRHFRESHSGGFMGDYHCVCAVFRCFLDWNLANASGNRRKSCEYLRMLWMLLMSVMCC